MCVDNAYPVEKCELAAFDGGERDLLDFSLVDGHGPGVTLDRGLGFPIGGIDVVTHEIDRELLGLWAPDDDRGLPVVHAQDPGLDISHDKKGKCLSQLEMVRRNFRDNILQLVHWPVIPEALTTFELVPIINSYILPIQAS